MQSKFIGILILTCLIESVGIAQGLQMFQPKYDEDTLRTNYIKFIDSLDPLVLTKDYPKAIQNLLSADHEKQILGIRTLKSTQEVEILPWLIPFVDSKDDYVPVEALQAIYKLVEYHVLKRRDYSKPGEIVIKPLQVNDPNLRPLAWLILQNLRLSDNHPNLRSYAASMAGYLNLQIFERELEHLLHSRHAATVKSAKLALEMLTKASTTR